MRKVLLAIDGPVPDRKLFTYAVDLCQRVTAELNILQVIALGGKSAPVKKIREKTGRFRKVFESSMMAATFAESGDPDTAKRIMERARKNIDPLLPESTEKGVPFDLSVTIGDPEKEIVDYVTSHRDVVIAVCDTPFDDDGVPVRRAASGFRGLHGSSLISRLKEKIDVPVVALNAGAPAGR